MGAAASVPTKPKSKWAVLKRKKVVLNKAALKVLDVVYTEMSKPIDATDIPGGERRHYHAINEVRRLRAKLSNLTRIPEKDCYTKQLTKAAAARSALKRNPEKTQRSTKFDRQRRELAHTCHTIEPSTELTAVENGMYAGGILRGVSCSTPRSTKSTPSPPSPPPLLRPPPLVLVPYNIFIRRAVINLPSLPTKSSDGTKSKVNRVLKVAEVDQRANLTLIENAPTRPEPNVVSILMTVSPDQEGQLLKGFPTILLHPDPDEALKEVRKELQKQWGLDAHVLSYHTDPDQDPEECGWRLFEVENHDSSWVSFVIFLLLFQNKCYKCGHNTRSLCCSCSFDLIRYQHD